MSYSIILADPAWPYNSRCTHSKTRFGGGVSAHYPTMSVHDICHLTVGGKPIFQLAGANAALFLWVTGPHMQSGLDVMRHWGFEFKSIAFTWVKTNKDGSPFFGPGYYTASNAELCLLGIRGRMKPANNDVSQVLLCPHPRHKNGRIIHSRKPAEARERIVRLFGDLPRVELFARESAPGWDVIGNQLAEGGQEMTPLRTQRGLFELPVGVA